MNGAFSLCVCGDSEKAREMREFHAEYVRMDFNFNANTEHCIKHFAQIGLMEGYDKS